MPVYRFEFIDNVKGEESSILTIAPTQGDALLKIGQRDAVKEWFWGFLCYLDGYTEADFPELPKAKLMIRNFLDWNSGMDPDGLLELYQKHGQWTEQCSDPEPPSTPTTPTTPSSPLVVDNVIESSPTGDVSLPFTLRIIEIPQ